MTRVHPLMPSASAMQETAWLHHHFPPDVLGGPSIRLLARRMNLCRQFTLCGVFRGEERERGGSAAFAKWPSFVRRATILQKMRCL